jgi:hypothetical protein
MAIGDIIPIGSGGGGQYVKFASAPTANDDGVDTSGNGVFAVGDRWLDTTVNIEYVCTDNTTTAAVWLDINTNQITVASSAPSTPIINQLWLDTSNI